MSLLRVAPLPPLLKAAEAQGLRVRDALVSSAISNAKTAGNSTTPMNGPGVDGTQKLAQAAEAIDQLLGVVDQLRDSRSQNVKLAAALVNAVKLAQDGVIDVGDGLTFAQRSIADGTVKLSALDELSVAPAAGEPVNVGSPAAQGQKLDVLTSYLRSQQTR
jgi:hypothetical protein